jgi:hypothetical protein
MAQSAAHVSAVDNLFSYNPKSFSVSKDNHKTEALVHELQASVDFIGSTIAFSYNNRIRLNISVNAPLTHFILIRGLIEFNRSKNLLVSYDKEKKTLEADFPEVEAGSVKNFLQNISLWLNEEIKFKSGLKHVIEFESRYKAERSRLYAALVN